MKTEFIFDAIPYPSFTFSQTHPDRLATMASLHGLDSAKPEKCRVLELGCGDGTNLLWCASTLVESEFAGIDLSRKHIEDANAGVAELGLTNISFYQQDIMEFTREKFGEFDYMIAHGFFSWVPDFVREKVLQIYSECLAPTGVGYISYNAFPGCHIRQMIRGMMKFHTNDLSDPTERVLQSRAIVNFISEAAKKDSLYQQVLKKEIETNRDRSDSGILHDDLSEVNDPFYFTEFIEKIRPYGLQYLCEAKASSSPSNYLTPKTVEVLDSLGDDIIRREQYLDLIIGRRFRSTLVCRENIMLDRDQNPAIINNFFIASQLTPESDQVNIRSLEGEKFLSKDGSSIETNHPLTKAALIHMCKLGKEEINFGDLIQEGIDRGGILDDKNFEEDVKRTVSFLLEMFKCGFIHLLRRKSRFASEAGEFPEASPFARLQVRKNSDVVRTLKGNNIKPPDKYVLQLLTLLDGTRNRTTLVAEMARLFEKDGVKREDFEKDLPESLNTILSQLAADGLLLE